MNAATLKMYTYTVGTFDHCYDFVNIDAEKYWLGAMEDFSEEYDEDWYALIATPAIRATINWDFINRKYLERRAFIEEKVWTY
jgi:hypothetical protein